MLCKEKKNLQIKAQKKSWFQGLQAEFEKIIWTDQSYTWQTDSRRSDRDDSAGRDHQQ